MGRSNKILFRDSIITLVTRVFLLGVTILSSVIVARTLGPSGNGVYAYVVVVAGLIANLGSLGLGVSNVFLVGKSRYELSEIASFSLLATICLGILWICISLVSLVFVPGVFFEGVRREYVLIAIFTVPFLLAFNFFSNIVLGKKKIPSFNLLNAAQPVFLIFSLSVLLLVFRLGEIGAIWAWATSVAVGANCSLLFVARLTRIRLFLNKHLAKEALGFGIKADLGNVFGLLNYRSSVLLLGNLTGAGSLGRYAIAIGLAELVLYLPNSISLALFPRVSSAGFRDANRLTPLTCRHTIFLTLGIVLSMFAVGKILVLHIYGSDYAAAVAPLYILLAGMVPLSIGKILSSDLTGRGRPIIPTLSSFVSFITIIVLLLTLVPKWGISGAAVATLIAYSADACIQLFFHLRISGNNLCDTLVLKPEDLNVYVSLGSATLKRAREVLSLTRLVD